MASLIGRIFLRNALGSLNGRVCSETCLQSTRLGLLETYRLVGLVVKASALRAEGPGFESRLRWDFFGVKSYQ